jgi:hypothetical protein
MRRVLLCKFNTYVLNKIEITLLCFVQCHGSCRSRLRLGWRIAILDHLLARYSDVVSGALDPVS